MRKKQFQLIKTLSCTKLYLLYSKHVNSFPSNIFRNGEHPTAFFTYTPEIVLSYVLQFNTELDWQYNKCQFYGCAHRPKADYIRPIRYDERMQRMLELFQNKMSKTQPFVFGSKEETINFLLGKK